MSKKPTDLLEKMRRSKSGWKRKDLDALYEGFGFVIEHRANHDVARHPNYPQFGPTLPRHGKLGKYLINQAIKTIDALIKLQEAEDNIIKEAEEKEDNNVDNDQ